MHFLFDYVQFFQLWISYLNTFENLVIEIIYIIQIKFGNNSKIILIQKLIQDQPKNLILLLEQSLSLGLVPHQFNKLHFIFDNFFTGIELEKRYVVLYDVILEASLVHANYFQWFLDWFQERMPIIVTYKKINSSTFNHIY